jgi:hypothetical protein
MRFGGAAELRAGRIPPPRAQCALRSPFEQPLANGFVSQSERSERVN